MKTKFNNSTIQQLNNRGFTLLELIIVFTVIAILSTVGITSFVSYSRSQSLQSAASDLASTLDSAKSQANSQVKPSQCSADQALDGYKVVIDDPSLNPSTKYSLYVVCGQSQLVKTATLPDNGKIKFILDPGQTTTLSVFFPIIKGGVQGAGNITLTGYNQSRCVNVSSGGVIKVLPSVCP